MTASPSLTSVVDNVTTPGSWNTSPVLLLCLSAAIGLVYLFCRQKFNERSVTENKDYVYQFLPSQLATPAEYNKGFLVYFGAMAFTVLLLSLIGPKDLGAFGISLPPAIADQASNVATPLVIAFLLVGIMPNVPVLQEVERRLRQYAHEIAYIPSAALAIAERLSTAKFDFTIYSEALRSEELCGVEATDFEQPRHSVEYAWARLSCLVYQQKCCLIAGSADGLDTSLLRAYKSDLDLIEASRMSTESAIEDYRTEKQRKPGYSSRSLNEAIRNDLYKLYILLGCAVRLKNPPHKDINLALKRLGFQLDDEGDAADTSDIMLVGIAILAATTLVLQIGAVGLRQLGLWQVTDFFPSSPLLAFSDTAWALIPHVLAIIVADLMRRRAIQKGRWFDRSGEPKSANYVRVAALSGLAGYAGLAIWGLIPSAPTARGFLIDAPNVLLGMVTGGFYVWHLDCAELNSRKPVWLELTSQSLATGLCGLIASATSFSTMLGSAADAFDRIIFNGCVAAAIGLALALYIPRAATGVDPLEAAKKERLQALTAAANRRFGGATAAEEWLDRPHPALDSQPPKIAAEKVDGFERAMSLLQGPQALAA